MISRKEKIIMPNIIHFTTHVEFLFSITIILWLTHLSQHEEFRRKIETLRIISQVLIVRDKKGRWNFYTHTNNEIFIFTFCYIEFRFSIGKMLYDKSYKTHLWVRKRMKYSRQEKSKLCKIFNEKMEKLKVYIQKYLFLSTFRRIL